MEIGGSNPSLVGPYPGLASGSGNAGNAGNAPGSVGQILPSVYTYATLPAASTVPPGTQAYTSDYGLFLSDGTNWRVVGQLPVGNRTTPSIAVHAGDSIVAGGTYGTTANASSVYGQNNSIYVTTVADINLWVGATVFCGGAVIGAPGNNNVSDDRFNGTFTIAQRVSSNSFVLTSPTNFGSSPVNASYSTYYLGNDTAMTARNFLAMANVYAGGVLDQIYCRGVSGCQTSYMLSRFAQDVLSLKPSLVFLGSFRNDTPGVVQSFANITAMCQMALAAGAIVILHTSTPYDSGAAGYSAATLDYYLQVNNQIRQYAASKPGVILFDLYALLTDTTTATGNYLANTCVPDKVHPSDYGVGQSVNNTSRTFSDLTTIIKNLYGQRKKIRATCQRDDVTVSSASYQLVNNPLLQGSGGTVTAGGAVGTAPTGWTLVGTGTVVATCSVPARADGMGNYIKCVFGASNTGSLVVVSQNNPVAQLPAGTKFRFGALITTTGQNLNNNHVELDLNIQDVSGATWTVGCLQPSGGSLFTGQDCTDGVYLSPIITVPPAGFLNVQFNTYLSIINAGALTVQISNIFIEIIQPASLV